MSNQEDTKESDSHVATMDSSKEEVRTAGDKPSVESGSQSRSSQEMDSTNGAGVASVEAVHSAEWQAQGKRASTGGRSDASDGKTGGPRDPQARQVREELLDQFYSTLWVMYLGADVECKETRAIHERIRAKLAGERTWRRAYEIEQLLAFIMTEDQIATELPRRMAEATELKLSFVNELEKRFAAVSKPLEAAETDGEYKKNQLLALRYILHRLLNDLQWFYDQRIRRRDAAKRLSVRVSALFLSAFLFFFGLLFVQYFTNRPPVIQEVQKSPQPPAAANPAPLSTERPHN